MYDIEQEIQRAAASFAEHQIVTSSEDRAYICSPTTSNYWTELISGRAGLLVIAGDGPNIALHTRRRDASLESLVRWCAGSNLDYLATKVSIGTAKVHDPEVMRQDLLAWCAEQRAELEELPHEECDDAAAIFAAGMEGVEEIQSVADDCHDLSEGECWRRIVDVHTDLGEHSFGQRYTSDLVAAWEACRRLVAIWDRPATDKIEPWAGISEILAENLGALKIEPSSVQGGYKLTIRRLGGSKAVTVLAYLSGAVVVGGKASTLRDEVAELLRALDYDVR